MKKFGLLVMLILLGSANLFSWDFKETREDEYYCENIDVYFHTQKDDLKTSLRLGRHYAEGASFNIVEKSDIDDFLLSKKDVTYYTYYRVLDNGMTQFRFVSYWDDKNVIIYEILSWR